VPVTYTRAGKGKHGHLFKVSGTLTRDEINEPDKGTTLRDVRYTVRGEQTYDPTQREWVSGKMTLDMSFTVDNGKSKTPMKGRMELKFERVSGTK